jgi:eukaryotic-like serine/threonine-protein kinase
LLWRPLAVLDARTTFRKKNCGFRLLDIRAAHRFKSGASLAAVGLAAMLAVWAMSLFSWIVALALLTGLLAVLAWRFAHRRRPEPEAEAAPAVPIEVRPRHGRGTAGPRRTNGEPHSGDVLGQYQLLACVGEGGMGRVWAARHVGSVLQRLVAVKTAIRDEEERTELRHLFMDEARIALLVRHPNVCGVHEFGEHEGVLYQVMEWCDGASLRQVLDRLPDGRMDPPVAARILAKVSAGLHAAHELVDDDGVPMHVVHRDVSPQNILISTNGQVKVTDFGVAKAHGQLHRPLSPSDIKGKLSYMAPEQILGREVDRRADIFALGCILYEATTGQAPFTGAVAPSTLVQLLSQPIVPPQDRVPGYPERLAAIVLRALGKEPTSRYSSAEQLGVELESWLAQSGLVVTERTIADLMTFSVEEFTRDKSARIEQALGLYMSPASAVSQVLIIPGPALAEARPTLPARPGLPRASLPVRPSVSARPTLPAGPAVRRPGAR